LILWLVLGLIVVGLMALFIEVFVPAGGLIGIAGIGCYIAGIVLTFRNFNPTTGFIMLAVSVVAAPIFFALAFRAFPRTFMGRRLILRNSQRYDSGYTSYTSEKYIDLVGQDGVAFRNGQDRREKVQCRDRWGVHRTGRFSERHSR
jgi:membrane-bound serine protease (ClpP class)